MKADILVLGEKLLKEAEIKLTRGKLRDVIFTDFDVMHIVLKEKCSLPVLKTLFYLTY